MGRGGVTGRLRRGWRTVVATRHTESTRRLWADVRGRHPGLRAAIAADARMAAARRGERHTYRTPLDTAVQVVRLTLVTDAFGAQCCYRAKAALQARGVPFLPRLLHRAAVVRGQISIGDPVVVEAGVYLPHGQVVIDGLTRIGTGAVIGPFVTIGLRAGDVRGPDIGARAHIGSGAQVIGPVRVGAGAVVGSGAVVVSDVAPGATVAGVPARPLG